MPGFAELRSEKPHPAAPPLAMKIAVLALFIFPEKLSIVTLLNDASMATPPLSAGAVRA